ncbi:uncharacterized protein LOC141946734 isoform X4 [Strix uralensis]
MSSCGEEGISVSKSCAVCDCVNRQPAVLSVAGIPPGKKKQTDNPGRFSCWRMRFLWSTVSKHFKRKLPLQIGKLHILRPQRLVQCQAEEPRPLPASAEPCHMLSSLAPNSLHSRP